MTMTLIFNSSFMNNQFSLLAFIFVVVFGYFVFTRKKDDNEIIEDALNEILGKNAKSVGEAEKKEMSAALLRIEKLKQQITGVNKISLKSVADSIYNDLTQIKDVRDYFSNQEAWRALKLFDVNQNQIPDHRAAELVYIYAAYGLRPFKNVISGNIVFLDLFQSFAQVTNNNPEIMNQLYYIFKHAKVIYRL